jgi:hypothetical protein
LFSLHGDFIVAWRFCGAIHQIVEIAVHLVRGKAIISARRLRRRWRWEKLARPYALLWRRSASTSLWMQALFATGRLSLSGQPIDL